LQDRDARVRGDRSEVTAESGNPTLATPATPTTPATPEALPTFDPRGMPAGGAAWGHCVHAILESVDLSQTVLAKDCLPALIRYGFNDGRAEAVATWLNEALLATVPVAQVASGARDFSLRQVAQSRPILRELEFDLRLDAQPQALYAVLAEQGPLAASVFQSDRIEGLLRGYIDAVIEHEGRIWVIDWKTNRLNADPLAYDASTLAEAMRVNGYGLQGLLYCAAMERWLRSWSAGQELQIGGIIYAFLRGAGVGAPGNGFWVQAFAPELIRRVLAALGARS